MSYEAVQLHKLGFDSSPDWLCEAIKNNEIIFHINEGTNDSEKTRAIITSLLPSGDYSTETAVVGDYILKLEDECLIVCSEEFFNKKFKPKSEPTIR